MKIRSIFTLLFLVNITAYAEDRLYLFSYNYATPNSHEVNLEYKIDYARRACLRCKNITISDINQFQQWIGVEKGVTDKLSLSAHSISSFFIDNKEIRFDSFSISGKYRLIESQSIPVKLGITFGYILENGGVSVIQTGAIITRDINRLNLTSNIQLEKAFEPMRDSIDMSITAGMSFRFWKWFSGGFEYAGWDLEDLWEKEEAEGGARHIIGPAGSFYFNKGRLQLLFTPAVQFTPTGEGIIARALVSHKF